ncbi:MAG: LptA/OstA family protein [Mariprofundaceae bacterium]|nr:LptA/OstA family protein [Mariprofundaceae bacterium]
MKQHKNQWAGVKLRSMSALIFVCSLFVAVNVQAATVTVQSDHLDIWEQKNEALFTGQVHLLREDFELFSDSLRVFYNKGEQGGGIDHALATGHVRMIQGDKKGSADSAVIDNKHQLVTLKGNAVMEQAGGRVQGETIVHDMAAKTTEVRQGAGGRVRLRIDDAQATPDGVGTPAAKASSGEVPPEELMPEPDSGTGDSALPDGAGKEQQP